MGRQSAAKINALKARSCSKNHSSGGHPGMNVFTVQFIPFLFWDPNSNEIGSYGIAPDSPWRKTPTGKRTMNTSILLFYLLHIFEYF